MRPNHGRGARGFTLVEVLVAVAVLGFLVVGLSQALRLGIAAWQRQSATIGGAADLEGLDRVLREMLSQAGAMGAEGGRFIGEPNRLRAGAVLPRALASTGRLARIDISVDRSGRLQLHWQPRLPASTGGPAAPGAIALLTGVGQVDFRYWTGATADQPAGWRDRWVADTPPHLIRIHLRFRDGDRREWPDFVIAPIVAPAAK